MPKPEPGQLPVPNERPAGRRLKSSEQETTNYVGPAESSAHDRLRQSGQGEQLPDKIGRFSIHKRLGSGGFGDVYLAHDPELDRLVALKAPRLDRFTVEAEVEAYIAEARAAARLRHPAIVSVHDVNRHAGQLCIVLEYIEGQDLGALLRTGRLDPMRAVALTIEIADAIAYAHEHGLVHRDIKPSNVLLDLQGRPYVADFGLAVRGGGQRLLRGEVAGTPRYMAPEQVRGETHRLDGRTDIWSLGVVFYQMLTGCRPFEGNTRREVFDEIEHREARPLRQLDRNIPRDLERICLKCLSKRMIDRYPTASDVAEDLRHWREQVATATGAGSESRQTQPGATATSESDVHDRNRQSPKVVPKGLRAFDHNDTDFFLALLPGPFDRDGLPEGIRFWKARIEETDPDKVFSVGLMYGPSGCGKSSLIQAGLIPRLADHIHAVYVEATADETEPRLLRATRRILPDLSQEDSLSNALRVIREERLLSRPQKLVFFLDQFEQWLHANRVESRAELVQALRHCDGQSIQCIVSVRDDFGMSAMRFMNALEVPVVEGRNYATSDLFDLPHGKKVLAYFGRAFGQLPEEGALSTEQERFLQQAAESLAEDGKIVPVRLALFAEMLRGKPWNPASLRRVGGAEGIGVAFLDETVGAGSSDPRRRFHRKGGR